MESIKSYKLKYGDNAKLGFIGGGNMAAAIIKGILKSKLFEPKNIVVSGRKESSLEQWKSLGITTSLVNDDVVNSCPIVFLCVKPFQMEDVAESVMKSYDEDAGFYCERKFTSSLVSILAGTSISKVKKAIPIFSSYIRAMPNTPLQVSAGCTALSQPVYGQRTTEKFAVDIDLNFKVVEAVFRSLGIAEIVEESKFDAVTGVSGKFLILLST